ncbi:helix-hairpin-helix domain-containing protein [Paenarthrobacter sp. Z7-10]|uniref:Tex family protein n=1 Tax=Paenarthrobacter sp. Z7-10 TaxID=2787635 RepID=UPI0022A9B804|nr:Tex-like N-terminal domain-containing protein [Paenarthrobacter sp. Z7-10]MCZ2404629.1 helix-hairpin-helix domain-containing protein [Paenarthrobacter sp. Z7-10]
MARVTVRAESLNTAIFARIAQELGVKPWQVRAAVDLLDGGATVPFVARYRKEATGTLDDAQLRTLEERLGYLRELEDRRGNVLEAIDAQGKLTPSLRSAVERAETKSVLEDLYLPYKSIRRTKAQMAREAGLEPLAEALLRNPQLDPAGEAAKHLNPGQAVTDAVQALAGARAILTERAGLDAALVSGLRERLWQQGRMRARVKAGKDAEGAKFKDFFDFVQPLHTLPSHRVLALLRGEKEGVLELTIAEADPRDADAVNTARARYESAVARSLGISDRGRPADGWLAQTAQLAWRSRILARLAADLRSRLFETAETEAVRVFAANLRDVLLAAPAGNRTVLGLDPGLRTGVKVAVVDGTGKVLATDTIYPHAPARKWGEALARLVRLSTVHGVELIAIGNGTASRESDKLAGELIVELAAQNPDQRVARLVVSEAGASVYSASALASAELPELDVTLRGAVSIARRLQDPLAELVKIEPKSIGVGQYQHDLSPAKLDRSLDAVVEDCVNAVGVDVNTASPALLARVAGVGALLSANIVAHRNEHGPFTRRAELKKVPRLGAKAFEQCAGFLRISGGAEPLDASSVHPEAYGVARRILAAAGAGAMGISAGSSGGRNGTHNGTDDGRNGGTNNAAHDGGSRESAIAALAPEDFADGTFGVPTVRDILAELVKPGRDPRPQFATATFSDGIEKIADLRPGMILEGTVSNVAAFGAFVDVGVHQDGLVHVSAMANKFVADPREIVKSGQVVRVKVLEVDPERKRISLTLRIDDDTPAPGGRVAVANSGGAAVPKSGRAAAPAADPVQSPRSRAAVPSGSENLSASPGSRPSNRSGSPLAASAGEGSGRLSGRRSAASASDTAMAEALRKAGLLGG